MAVPASVIEILENNKIAYQLKASQHRIESAVQALREPSTEPCLVKSAVLKDAQGMLLVLLPSNYLLDLAATKAQFGRNLNHVPAPELHRLLGDASSVPAIPDWKGLTTLVDASLLQHPTLWLETGDQDQLLELSQTDFQSIIQSACLGELAVPAPELPSSAELDREQIVHSLKSFTEKRIKQRLEETLELPPLPDSAQRIIQLRADPNADISDLANIVELDPSLAAQVVSWASSPYYSAPGKIKSVQDAIVRVLGFDMVLNLALGLALGKSLNATAITPAQLKSYWINAVSTAATVEALVTSIEREHRPGFGLSYLSGLLYNFGIFVSADVFPPYFENIERHCEVNQHINRASIEQHLIGVSSCQMVSWLMQAWNMPEEVVTALRQQHNPAYDGPNAAYPRLIFVARQLLAEMHNGVQLEKIPPALLEELHIDTEKARDKVQKIFDSTDDLAAIASQIQG